MFKTVDCFLLLETHSCDQRIPAVYTTAVCASLLCCRRQHPQQHSNGPCLEQNIISVSARKARDRRRISGLVAGWFRRNSANFRPTRPLASKSKVGRIQRSTVEGDLWPPRAHHIADFLQSSRFLQQQIVITSGTICRSTLIPLSSPRSAALVGACDPTPGRVRILLLQGESSSMGSQDIRHSSSDTAFRPLPCWEPCDPPVAIQVNSTASWHCSHP